MRTHSKALLLFLILWAGGILAASPKDAFAANREDVLAGRCLKAEGVCFGIGEVIPKSDTSQAQISAFDKAQLLATVNLVGRKAVSGIAWPDALDSRTKSVLAAFVANDVSVSATVKGAETVFKGAGQNGSCRVVVAVDESALSVVRPVSFADVRRILLNPHWLKRHLGKYRKELVAFYVTQKELPSVLKGTDFNLWTEAQINLFCGLPPPVARGDSSTNVSEHAQCAVNDDTEEIHPEFILPPYATGNENETIGF